MPDLSIEAFRAWLRRQVVPHLVTHAASAILVEIEFGPAWNDRSAISYDTFVYDLGDEGRVWPRALNIIATSHAHAAEARNVLIEEMRQSGVDAWLKKHVHFSDARGRVWLMADSVVISDLDDAPIDDERASNYGAW